MRPIPRFLVLRGGAIGDFIVTLPVLAALRERWPEAHVELIGYPHVARLALAGGLADHVRSLDEAGMSRYFSPLPAFDDEQRRFLASFHIVFSYLHDPDGLVRDNLVCAGARRIVYGSPLVTEGHAIEHMLKPLEGLAIYVEGAWPRLPLSEALRDDGQRRLAACGLGRGALAIHPGSGSPAKNWPAERFADLARRLAAEKGKRPFFIIGEADAGVARVVADRAPEVPVMAGISLETLAGVLSQCGAYVGNDSGVTHVAAAVGVPVVALFGPTEPGRWGPRGPHVVVLRAPDHRLDSIPVEQVLQEARGPR